jgi:lipopolysaccharide transport system ATP-binding protein
MTLISEALAVRAVDLGKRYSIGAAKGENSLYDRFAGSLRGRGSPAPHEQPSIWALRNVSFEVPHGQVIGLIGRNGSGKTTLLKMIARVTAPTEGMAAIRGRVGALLQVGAGFHPELSGRDNIALSGAILGMSRSEIAAISDQIVDFAEIGPFLDSPVKHYSSGMHLRLAFAVSAHIPAEIMLVDEILSVGDAPFQQKCQRRMRELVDGEGRTILFVSHSMKSVIELCDSALVLDGGNVRFMGDTKEAVDFYESEVLHLLERDRQSAQPQNLTVS